MKADSSSEFNPNDHLMKVSDKDYLPVAWRLVWLREDHADASIATAIVEHSPGEYALFRAEIHIPNGGSATGWGSETIKDFRDYLEKAETKAVGRALAALGYGTQFADDFNYEKDDGTKVVDSPVERTPSPMVAEALRTGDAMTGPQRSAIFAIGRGMGIEGEEIEDMSLSRFNKRIGSLSKREATDLIDQLKKAATEQAKKVQA